MSDPENNPSNGERADALGLTRAIMVLKVAQLLLKNGLSSGVELVPISIVFDAMLEGAEFAATQAAPDGPRRRVNYHPELTAGVCLLLVNLLGPDIDAVKAVSTLADTLIAITIQNARPGHEQAGLDVLADYIRHVDVTELRTRLDKINKFTEEKDCGNPDCIVHRHLHQTKKPESVN